MIRTLYSGASGLKSHQTRLDVVGHNISNVNTVGYKSSRASFADVLSQNIKGASAAGGRIGSTNALQIGLGVDVASIDTAFIDGAPMTTGKNTDLCLSGDGLFVVKRGNETYYTRDGAFDFDAEGNYVLPGSGYFVQGWTATDGVIDTSGEIGDIKIPRTALFPATEDITPATDVPTVNAPTIMGISVNTYEPLAVGVSGKGFTIYSIPIDGKTWRFAEDVPLGATRATIEDGEGHTRTVTFSPAVNIAVAKGRDAMGGLIPVITKDDVTRQYPLTLTIDGKQYTAIGMDQDIARSPSFTLKPGGAVAGSNTITVTDGTNDVTFTLNTTLTESIGQSQTEVTSAVATAENPVTLTLSDGATVTKIGGSYEVGALLDDSTSDYDSTSTNTNGVEAMLREIQIDSSGRITGIYSNGMSRVEAQVALAHFDNSPGLVKTGTSLYKESVNSGPVDIIEVGEFKTVIIPGALEMSNVDVASEFADMIVTQRGFQSNAKSITVGDEMLETAINMKR